jgi:predicted DNA-binding ribbon-helix-helix protein
MNPRGEQRSYHSANGTQNRLAQAMIRKTMRIGEVRTSIKLEPEFWSYLKEVADSRTIRLSRLVNDVAAATPERTNLASTLRTFCLIHAQLRWRGLERELEQLSLAGNTRDLTRVLDACPLPCLLLSEDRTIKRLNQAFAAWLHLDARGVLGHRLDNIMILRGQSMPGLWERIFGEAGGRGRFNATYVSPGKVRTAQALAVGLSPNGTGTPVRACLIMFETLAGRA